jgi:hypothetical protein
MHLKTWLAGVVFGAVIAAGVGIAYAAIPDGTGTVHACWQNVTSPKKPVKLLNTTQKTACPSGWNAVAWNQRGQPGTNGVSGYSAATATNTGSGGSTNMSAQADCPSGKVPLGGGFTTTNLTAFVPFGVAQDGPAYVRDATNKIVGGGWTVNLQSENSNFTFGANQTLRATNTARHAAQASNANPRRHPVVPRTRLANHA